MKWVLMKAVCIREQRPVADLKVSEVPTPSIGPGEELVKVEALGINLSEGDVKTSVYRGLPA